MTQPTIPFVDTTIQATLAQARPYTLSYTELADDQLVDGGIAIHIAPEPGQEANRDRHMYVDNFEFTLESGEPVPLEKLASQLGEQLYNTYLSVKHDSDRSPWVHIFRLKSDPRRVGAAMDFGPCHLVTDPAIISNIKKTNARLKLLRSTEGMQSVPTISVKDAAGRDAGTIIKLNGEIICGHGKELLIAVQGADVATGTVEGVLCTKNAGEVQDFALAMLDENLQPVRVTIHGKVEIFVSK